MRYLDNYLPQVNFATVSRPCASLIHFGEEIAEIYDGNGDRFYVFNSKEGEGYVAYHNDDNGNYIISDIYAASSNPRNLLNVIEDLIYTVRNHAAALKVKLIIESDDEAVNKFLDQRNESMKHNKIDDKYLWKQVTNDI